ncbi:MAG: universal stress protein [Methanothrix sp.]
MMFEKILIPTDFSKHARKVVECAGQIPGVKDVVLLHVISRDPLARVWDPVAEIREAEKRLEGEAAPLQGMNVKVRAVSVLEGEVASAIQKVADEENVSLVAMGARGKSLIESVLLGSVSRNVLRYGNTHLILMRYRMMEGKPVGIYCARLLHKVLYPTDFSQPAEAALSFLKNISGIGELMLLHVVSRGETQEEIDSAVKYGTDRLNEIATELRKGGLNVSTKVVVGEACEQIRSVANQEDVSLIAMSSQGATAIKKGRIGSTAYGVANTASRPVLILRSSKIAIY